uniref:NADH dehydrogenase subunit 6 n=1 Tax=Haemaphysalis colasbelcouri TaxID=2926932 RepID=A0A976R6S2_9ACAR|nr:NADH dehydrogenase subunit 6 [Haemaphysalis colasbelcouri]UNO54012.1 NADH dehydrogenase subunit 6 [Haemaphysalis colasbelcouri]
MKMIMFMSVTLMMMSHPMMMLMSIMLLTLFLSMTFYYCSQLAIVSMIMILLILGGMLVIFMYMISLCPNKKINFNKNSIIMGLIILMTSKNFFLMKFEISNFIKMYSNNSMNLLLLMMMYLIISLTVVMKISNSNQMPVKMN